MFKLLSFLEPKTGIVYNTKPLVGGSSADVVLISGDDYITTLYPEAKPESPIVRKSASSDNVFSNGLAHVKGEFEHYMSLSRSNPELSRIFPKVLGDGTLVEKDGSRYYFDMEYVGESIPDLIQASLLPWETLEHGFREMWSTLWTYGYNPSLCRLSDSESRHELFSQFYIETLEDRIDTIKKHNASFLSSSGSSLKINELLYRPFFTINNIDYKNPLMQLLKDKALFEYEFAPYVTSMCIHGELNPGNTAFRDKTMFAFDPHPPGGTQQPSYDLGKFLMGLSGFSDIIQSNFELSYSESKFSFRFLLPTRSSFELSSKFINFIKTDDVFKPLREAEPNLVNRVSFISMYQLLRDMVYRAEKKEPNKLVANLLLASILFNQRVEPVVYATPCRSGGVVAETFAAAC